MSRTKQKKTVNLSKGKQTGFNFIVALFPIILIVLLELILRIVGYGDNLSLFIKHPDKAYNEYKVVNPEIGKKYFQKFEYSHPAKDIYLKNKPAGVFRIFVMGSSTVVGFPFDNNLMFSRILSKRLEDAYPDKKIEIINTAITAINSFSLLDFMPQVLKEKPDAILFYAGHNEFYGAFGAGSNEAVTNKPLLINMHLKLMNFRVYQLARNVISGILNFTHKSDSASAKRGTLMSRIVKNADITFGSELYKKGINDYQNNLDKMLAMAESKDVPVYISNVFSNLSGKQPFKSISTDELEGAKEYFMKARSDESNKDFNSAYINYTKARDYDCIRFRASSDINDIIEKMAKKHNSIFVPTLQLFEKNSRSGIIGDKLMTEHVYPNVKGEFLLAESFFQSLVNSKLIADNVNIYTSKPFKYFTNNYGYTYLDYLNARHRINNLKYCWPFKDETNEFIDYRDIYKPNSMIDSMAFYAMASKNETLLNAHETLALKYENEGNYLNAFKEYNALVQIAPYWSVYYRNAADCLLKMNDLSGALNYYEDSNAYGDSFHAHFKAGEICLIKNDLDNAISHFEEAIKLADKDEKMSLLTKLYISYTYAGVTEKVKQIAAEIDEIEPGKKIVIPARRFTFSRYIPMQVQLQIDDADEFLARANIETAVQSLLKSLSIYDTPIANRKLGEIYYKNKELLKSLYYLQKVYDDYKGDVSYLHSLILSNLSNRNKNEAQLVLEQLKKVDPQNIDIEKLQGYIDDFSS